MELLSERILVCTVDPVEGSLTVFINAVKTTLVNLHPEVAEKFLQFFYWIISQVLVIRVRVKMENSKVVVMLNYLCSVC